MLFLTIGERDQYVRPEPRCSFVGSTSSYTLLFSWANEVSRQQVPMSLFSPRLYL